MISFPIYVLIPILILIEGVFAGSEIALLSSDRLELKKRARKGSYGAQLALSLTERPERILSTTLLMTSLCAIGISSAIAIKIEEIPMFDQYSGIISIAASSFLVIIFGEIMPKTIFQRFSHTIGPSVAFLIYWVYLIFFPITKLLSIYTSRLSGLVGPIFELISGKKRTSRDEIEAVLSYGRRETGIATEEKRMIKRIFDFKDTEAKHALIPLVKVDAVEEGATVRQALERFQQHRHSCMPVYSGRVDNIVGTVKFGQLLGVANLDSPMRPHMTPGQYTPETQVLEDLLAEMHQDKFEMATIVDEYGGAVGILTLEDIVEEVVGEIHDEYDSRKLTHRQINDNSWWIQARMEIQLVNEQLHLELPEGDYETVGGFLLQQFGRIPEPGDELYFDTPAGAFRFVIKQANERAIDSVLIEKLDRAGAHKN